MGFPGGDLQQFVERWRGDESRVGTGTTLWIKTNLQWSVGVVSAASGRVNIVAPDVAGRIFTPNIIMVLGTGGSDTTQVVANETLGLFAPSRGIAMDFDLFTDTVAVDQMKFVAGMASVSLTTLPIAGFAGACIYKGNADANWKLVAGDGTALSAVVDTGVSVATSTHYKMRLEYLGSGVADDSTNAVRAYINGALVGTVTTNLPGLGGTYDPMSPFFSMARDSGSAARAVNIGQMRLTVNNP